MAALLCRFLCDRPGSVEAVYSYDAGNISVRIRAQGSDSLQGWPQWGVTLCLPLLSQGEFMFTAALSLSFAWYGLLANFHCARTIKGTETDSSAQRKRKGFFFCYKVKHFNTPLPFWKFEIFLKQSLSINKSYLWLWRLNFSGVFTISLHYF